MSAWYRDASRYFIHTCQVLRGPIGVMGSGTDDLGNPIVSATPQTVTVNCRVEFDNTRVIDDTGQEIVCAGRVFLPWSYVDSTGTTQDLDLAGQDMIIFEGRRYAIARRDRQEGWTGDRGRHWEAYIR